MQKERFIRQEMLLGGTAMEQLAAAHVLVCGVGGVGSFSAESLARAGVGRITLLDSDTVARSNINRQLIALESTIGRPKVAVAAERIADINPECRVTPLHRLLTAEEVPALLDGGFDYVIDAIDMVTPKLALIEHCIRRGIPVISALGTGNKLDPARLQVTDISKTSVCPLARVVRRELKNRGIAHHKVLFSTEEPITPAPLCSEEGRRAIPGSTVFVPPVAGILLAREAVLEIIGR